MIEAIPLAGENIILQITKVEYPEELDTRFSRFSEGEEDEEEETTVDSNLFSNSQGADDILDLFQKMKQDLEEQVEEKEKQVENINLDLPKTAKKESKESVVPANLTKLFEFTSLEQIERLARVLGNFYTGENNLYKDEHKNRFYLLVRKSTHSPEEFNKVCNIISEYGLQKKYTAATEAFFLEHGKVILLGNALAVLGSLN